MNPSLESARKRLETPGRVKWVCRPIKADNEVVYRKHLGLDGQQLKELRENGVV